MTAPEAIGVALLIIGVITFSAMSARACVAHADRRYLLGLLAEYGPLDGGHLLSTTPMAKSHIVKCMAELECRGLVEHQPSTSDPFWRDVWRLTEAGKQVAP